MVVPARSPSSWGLYGRERLGLLSGSFDLGSPSDLRDQRDIAGLVPPPALPYTLQGPTGANACSIWNPPEKEEPFATRYRQRPGSWHLQRSDAQRARRQEGEETPRPGGR